VEWDKAVKGRFATDSYKGIITRYVTSSGSIGGQVGTGSTEPAGGYIIFCGKGNQNREFGTVFFVHKIIISTVKGIGFVSNKMSRVIQKGLWCDIVVLKVHAPTEVKIDDMKWQIVWGIGTCIR
jgi:hypothetical protein